jgi:hypothetical protein
MLKLGGQTAYLTCDMAEQPQRLYRWKVVREDEQTIDRVAGTSLRHGSVAVGVVLW